jgi:3-oxoacyl-[acyl-carrier-protein] synthase III
MTTTLSKPSLRVTGAGSALPGRDLPGALLTNRALSELSAQAADRLAYAGVLRPVPPCTPKFPAQRIGVLERRVLDASLGVRDLAVEAARRALAGAGASAADRLRIIVVASVSVRRPVPSVSSVVAAAVGAPEDVFVIDLVLGCSGYMAALQVAANHLAQESPGSLALVVGAEAMTRLLDVSDRTTMPIFGDGAGALVLEQTAPAGRQVFDNLTLPSYGPRIRIEPVGREHGPLLRLHAANGGVSLVEDTESRLVVRMDGRSVFRDMVRLLPEFVGTSLARRGRDLADFSRVAFHQANQRLVEAVARGLELPSERLLMNIARVGNTTGASLPILLDEAARAGDLRAGDDVLLVGFGTGYSASLTSLLWS